MANLPLVIAENDESAATAAGHPHHHPGLLVLPRERRRIKCCCPGYLQRPWTAERIAHTLSNVFILLGCLTALVFVIYAVKDVTTEYTMLTVFIVGGTLFGGGCLLALSNVSWLSRRPGVRVSAIQVICNVVLALITSYLELLFWPYPAIAFSILFAAGIPMFFLINLPSCFMKKFPELVEHDGDTVCLDEDALDDATIVEETPKELIDSELTSGAENGKGNADADNTQRTMEMEEDAMMFDVMVDIEAPRAAHEEAEEEESAPAQREKKRLTISNF